MFSGSTDSLLRPMGIVISMFMAISTVTGPILAAGDKQAQSQTINRAHMSARADRPVPVPLPKPAAIVKKAVLLPTRGWSSEEIDKARAECSTLLKSQTLKAEYMGPEGGPEGCGAAALIRISAFSPDEKELVRIKPPARLNCKEAVAIGRWLKDVVQPAASRHFGYPVVGLRNASSYVCRRRYNRSTGRMSEHALGNALDISSFKLSNGRNVTVRDGWPQAEEPQGIFLREVHGRACDIFGTVLGPEANKAHADHFHLDLGRGGICE